MDWKRSMWDETMNLENISTRKSETICKLGFMMTEDIVLTIPSSLAQEMKLPPDTIREELMSELAISLYQRGIISSAQACRLAGLDRYQFEDFLWKRQIPVHYSEEDLDKDIRYATGNI